MVFHPLGDNGRETALRKSSHHPPPDLKRTGPSRQIGRLIVITPNPHHAQVITGKAGKPAVPTVIGGARLARHLKRVGNQFIDGPAGALAHDLLHCIMQQMHGRRLNALLQLQIVA